MSTRNRSLSVVLLGLLVSLSLPSAAFCQGLVLPGAGPINLSMAGASTATAVDVGGSYWNPAIISGLPRSEMLISSQFLLPSIHLESFLPAGSVGGIFPRTGRSGTSRSDSGVAAVPTAMLAFRLSDDSPWTFGLGSQYLSGGGVNFPASSGAPIVSPHTPPRYFGVGPIYSNVAVGLSSIIASRQVTDRLAIAAGPLVAVESLSIDPAVFAAPVNRVLTGGYPTFPSAFHQRPFWGGGFQVGLFFEMNENWNLGFSYKSPIWQERWGFNSATATGAPNRVGVQASLPEIISWGIAYKGIERTIIDLDLRYLDYANTSLFGTAAPPQGTGLGWSSVFAVALGGQYQATDKLSLRAGYLFNTNPVPNERTLLNVQLPAITQNLLAFGTSYRVTDDITFSLAYTHQFRNSMSGPILQLPGTSVREDVQIDSIIAGLNIQFGGKRKAASGSICEPVAQAAPASAPAPTVQTASPPASPTAPADPAVQTTAAPGDANEPAGRLSPRDGH
jgi:long-chain fatty acid transport protein